MRDRERTFLSKLKNALREAVEDPSASAEISDAAQDTVEALERSGLVMSDEDTPVERDGDVEVLRVIGPPYTSAKYQRAFVAQLEDALRGAGFEGSAREGFERSDAAAQIEGLDGDVEDDPAPWIEITQR